MNSVGRRTSGLVRASLMLCGGGAVAWSIFTFPTFTRERALDVTVQRVLTGERYSPAQLSALRDELSESQEWSLRPSVRSKLAIIRLRLVEDDMATGRYKSDAVVSGGFASSIDATLSDSPTSAFLWLTKFWLAFQQSGSVAPNFDLLRMSYFMGPNEVWIALRRNPLALSLFARMPDDLADRSIVEFAGLVRSGLYSDAASILTGPGMPIGQRLLDGLARVDEVDRYRFAKLLEAKDVQGFTIPGIKETGVKE
ncbi:hypothetical protein WI604_25725 [Bradyrhizobium symbiodeficiens]|uniref:hypothetical protein n=1 Tax=Bradyrhizobium symbiodeficiens TaxID=1404367 RepID=UPI0030D47AAC